MTVAAGIETGAGGHQEPGRGLFQAKGLGKAPGSVWAGAAQGSSSSSAGRTVESFQSNWQAQFASLCGGMDSLNAESESASEIEDVPEAPVDGSAPSVPALVPPVLAGGALPSKTGKQQPSSQVARHAVVPLVPRTVKMAPSTTVRAPKQSTEKGTVARATPARPSKSPEVFSEHSGGTSELGRSAWGTAPPKQISETSTILPLEAAIPIAPIPIMNAAIPQPESSQEPGYAISAGGVSANGSSERLAATGSFAQETGKGTAGATVVRGGAQSRAGDADVRDVPATVSGTGAGVDSEEARRPQPSGLSLPLSEASSASDRRDPQTDSATDAGLHIQAKTQSPAVELAETDFPAAVSAPVSSIDGREEDRLQPSFIPAREPSSASGWPVTETKSTAETGIQVRSIAQSQEVDARTQIAPQMPAVKSPLFDMREGIAVEPSASPVGNASSHSGRLETEIDSAAASGIRVRTRAQSRQVDAETPNSPRTTPATRKGVESAQPGRAPTNGFPVGEAASASGYSGTGTGNFAELGEQVRASAPSPQADAPVPSTPGRSIATEVGVEGVQPWRAQPSAGSLSDRVSTSGLPEPARSTPRSAGIDNPARVQEPVPNPEIPVAPERSGASAQAVEKQARSAPGSVFQVHADAQEAVAGGDSRVAKTAPLASPAPEVLSFHPLGLRSSGETTISRARDVSNPATLPAYASQPPGQPAPPVSTGGSEGIANNQPETSISSDLGTSRPDWPATATDTISAPAGSPAQSIANHRYPAEAPASRLGTQPNAVQPVAKRPTQAAGFGPELPLVQGPATVSPNTPFVTTVAGPESSGLIGSGPGSFQASQRTMRGAATDGRRGLSNQAQPAAVPGEPSGLVHDPAAIPAQPNPANGHAQIPAPFSPGEAFAALDAEPAPGKQAWTHASPRQAEAGFEDPALGWVGVRADLSGGGVHASLVPASTQAAQDLGRHMDGLNTYLAEQHTPVDSLVMAAPVERAADSTGRESTNYGARPGTEEGMLQGMNQGMSQGMHQGAGDHNAHQQTYADRDSSPALRMTDTEGPVAAQTSVAAVGADGSAQSRAGMHISVVA